ncbi:MAG: dTDP-glucose 4,6-dehydratase [Opitutales bacterium]|nr:dTDP-glucose 4,6-dehydratase [Opitutales bacterium]
MKFLITGGSGFIGSNFIHHLFAQDEVAIEEIINVDILSYAGNPENLSFYEKNPRYCFYHTDIGQTEDIVQILDHHQPDGVFNFAAESHVDRSIDSPEPFFRTNVIGTLRLLEAFRAYHRKQSPERQKELRFLHISTDEVYGSLSPNDPAFTEETPFAPNSPYAASKASSDHIIRAAHHTYGLPVLTTNCSNNYGPYQFPEKLIPLMILNALEGKPLPIYGDGQNIRDWLYVEDHCRALRQVWQRGQVGETYNIGGKNEKTNIEIVDTICDLLDQKAPSSIGHRHQELKTFVADRPGHDRRYAVDTSKIQRELGWSPRETFTSGIEKTIQWYLEHRSWCERITSGKYQRQRLGL